MAYLKFYFRTVKFQSKRKFIAEEEIIDTEYDNKQPKLNEQQGQSCIVNIPSSDGVTSTISTSTTIKKAPATAVWNKSVGGSSRRILSGLVKMKKTQSNKVVTLPKKIDKGADTVTSLPTKTDSSSNSENPESIASSLSLLASYSDSESD